MKSKWKQVNRGKGHSAKKLNVGLAINREWMKTAPPELVAYAQHCVIELTESTGCSSQIVECLDKDGEVHFMIGGKCQGDNVDCSCGFKGRVLAAIEVL